MQANSEEDALGPLENMEFDINLSPSDVNDLLIASGAIDDTGAPRHTVFGVPLFAVLSVTKDVAFATESETAYLPLRLRPHFEEEEDLRRAVSDAGLDAEICDANGRPLGAERACTSAFSSCVALGTCGEEVCEPCWPQELENGKPLINWKTFN